jgi:hypothetical protein
MNNSFVHTLASIIIALLSTLSIYSCKNNYHVIVNKESPPIVHTYLDWESAEMTRLQTSEYISGIDSAGTLGYPVTFTVKYLDSLGGYLPGYYIGFFEIQERGDTLIIRDIQYNSNSNNVNKLYGYSLTIETDRPIREVIKSTGTFKQIDNYRLIFTRSRKDILKGKRPMNMKVVLSSR